MYIDGSQVFTGTGYARVSNYYANAGGPIDMISIGADGLGNFDDYTGFNGNVDDVAIYSQALSDNQVHELYAMEAPAHGLAVK